MTTDQPIHHPAFPPPTSEHASLWRYMDVGKFKWLIAWQRLYMPSVAPFPDHLEGTTPEGHTRWWREQMASAGSAEARATMTRNQVFLEAMATRWREHYYVSCWHVNENENLRMWSAYTSTAEAVAIRTTYRLLRVSLPRFVELGMVRYIDYRSADLPSMNIMQRITHKDQRFSFEQELRAVALPPITPELDQTEFNDHLFEVEARPGVRVYAPPIEPGRLIQTVVLHPDAPTVFVERMKELCSANSLPAPHISLAILDQQARSSPR